MCLVRAVLGIGAWEALYNQTPSFKITWNHTNRGRVPGTECLLTGGDGGTQWSPAWNLTQQKLKD